MSLPKILYDNRFDDGTPVASTTASGDYDVLNLRDWRPYTWWQPTALPATVTVDCGSAKAADYFLVYGHDLFTQGATIELRGSNDNFAADDNLVATKTPTDDNPFMMEFASVSYRYWRIRITGATMPSLAIAVPGAVMEIPSYLTPGFDPIGAKVKSSTNTSKQGHPLGKVVDFSEWKQTLNFEVVTWAWLRATWEPAWEAHLRSEPFVFVWESTSYSDELRMVVSDNQYSAPHQPGQYANLSFTVMGVI